MRQRKKRHYRKKKFFNRKKIGAYLLIIGLILTIISFLLEPFFESILSPKLSFKKDKKLVLTKKEPPQKYPVRIIIQSLNLDLLVSQAVIKNKEWPVATDSANYLVGSGLPNDKGNLVIYGHALWQVFGPILNITPGQRIILEAKDKQFYRYQVEEIKIVWPNETAIIEPTTEETLTLYTCYGWFDSQRFVVIAKPVKDKREVAKVKRVIDGDTIELQDKRRIRYIGINTPEIDYSTPGVKDPDQSLKFCFGQEAKEKNKELLAGKMIDMEKDISEFDKYNRLLRYVYVDDLFINDWLVENGYAQIMTIPPDIKYAKIFLEKEKRAREEKRGLWGECF